MWWTRLVYYIVSSHLIDLLICYIIDFTPLDKAIPRVDKINGVLTLSLPPQPQTHRGYTAHWLPSCALRDFQRGWVRDVILLPYVLPSFWLSILISTLPTQLPRSFLTLPLCTVLPIKVNLYTNQVTPLQSTSSRNSIYTHLFYTSVVKRKVNLQTSHSTRCHPFKKVAKK